MSEKLDLVGIYEITQLLGVSRQRVDKITRTDETFPEPVAEIQAGRIWLRRDVLGWVTSSGRETKGLA